VAFVEGWGGEAECMSMRDVKEMYTAVEVVRDTREKIVVPREATAERRGLVSKGRLCSLLLSSDLHTERPERIETSCAGRVPHPPTPALGSPRTRSMLASERPLRSMKPLRTSRSRRPSTGASTVITSALQPMASARRTSRSVCARSLST